MIMKKWMAGWIALAMMLCVLTGCGEKARIDIPSDQVFKDDVKDYIRELLDGTAMVNSFEKKSSDRDNDELIVACAVSYSGEQGSNQGIFTLSYRSDGTQWILKKCKVELESPPESSAENPLEENQDIPADETSGNTQSQQSNTPTDPQPTKPVTTQSTEPVVTEPVVTEPVATEPAVTEPPTPVYTEPEPTQRGEIGGAIELPMVPG